MNRLEMRLLPRPPKGAVSEEFARPMSGGDAPFSPDYLRDESRIAGAAEKLFLPGNEAEISAVVQEARRRRTPVTVSAGRTGVVGGAVPQGGWILSVEKMSQVHHLRFDEPTREFRLTIGPGMVLQNLRRALQTGLFPFAAAPTAEEQNLAKEFRSPMQRWVFPPDPTEKTAQLGGMAATNASGARTYRYGPTRSYIRALSVVLPSGEVLDLRRGQATLAPGERFEIVDSTGKALALRAPGYAVPTGKHACGFFAAPALDPIDLFIGSEGTLGVISELEIAVIEVTGREAEIAVFLPDADAACRFVDLLRRSQEPGLLEVEAIEYMCRDSLRLLEAIPLHPRIALGEGVAVFLGCRLPGNIPPSLEYVAKLVAEAGGDPAATLAALTPGDFERIAQFRHALPETVNAIVAQARAHHPQLTKLGTDMAVPDACLAEVMALYSRRLREAGLRHVVFGHIGNNHLHVNILPRDPGEYARGKELYQEFGAWVVGVGGSVSAEHGIGKLKKYLMEIQFDRSALAEMRALKAALDPDWLLCRGNLFEPG